MQWLDRASALALGVVAQRLEADRVALVLAARDSVEVKELWGWSRKRGADLRLLILGRSGLTPATVRGFSCTQKRIFLVSERFCRPCRKSLGVDRAATMSDWLQTL